MPSNNPTIWIFAPVTAILLVGAAIAYLVPATYVDPMQTLRSD
jgi:hypothetical protein